MKELTLVAVSNIICNIMFGSRLHRRQVKETYLPFRREQISPVLRFLPGDLFSLKRLTEIISDIKDFVADQIEVHRKTLEEENLRDFIDAFLVQQRKHEPGDPLFDDMNITITIVNIFPAGTDTTATMIRLALLYLIHNKPIQDKLRQEIMTVAGTSRLPSLADKTNMPYHEAFITEVFWVGNIGPLSVPHGARKDINFRGMVIPKGSTIIPYLDSVMSDPELFEDPDKFQPERFLGLDGELNGKERNVTAFSLGRRVCMEESLARMELFLLMTSLIQRFEFLPESQDKFPSLDGIVGFGRTPKDFSCRAVKLQ